MQVVVAVESELERRAARERVERAVACVAEKGVGDGRKRLKWVVVVMR